MQHIHFRSLLIAAFVLVTILPQANAQSNGNKSNMVNKTWRILAMKCPEAYNSGNDPDQYVHYYATLTLTPSNGQSVNYGSYVMVHRDMSENPVERGSYSIVTDDANVTRLILKPRKTETTGTFVIESAFPNYLTLIDQSDNAKCRVSYAIAP